jgi:signal transduction histidine kinase
VEHEVLFVFSPTTIVLSLVAVILAATFPIMLGQKAQVRQLPWQIMHLIVTIMLWHFFSVVGTLCFSGENPGIGGYIVFGLQALVWVQCGYVIYSVGYINLPTRTNPLWRILCFTGMATVVICTVLLCAAPEKVVGFTLFGHTPFASHPVCALFAIIFFVFVFPPLLAAIYALLRNTLESSDLSQSQIGAYMTGSLSFFVVVPLLFDFVFPVIYNYNIGGTHPHFMLWYQYSYIFLTMICGQYFTSVSFKNKSAYWLLIKMTKSAGDCIFSYDVEGKILSVNPAAETLFGQSESDLQKQNIYDLFPDLDLSREHQQSNVKISIHNEEHYFNVGVYHVQKSMTTHTCILLLSDQSNSLFYKQRIEALNTQFAEYKQDLLRYQDRLDASQKKYDENNSFLSTLINALPFQFWAKNEHGVYMAQNQKDLEKRGNLYHTTDNPDSISLYEQEARENGSPSSHTSFELQNGTEISEDDANVQINSGKAVNIFENMFIPIIAKQAPYKIIGIKIDMTEQKRLEREKNILQEQKNIHSRLEELGTLCGAFAHDYNNILGSQIGFCQLAAEMLASIPADSSPDANKIQAASSFVAEATKAAQRGKESLEELLNTIRGQTKGKGDMIVFAPYMIVEDVKKKLSLTLPPNISIASESMDKTLRISGIPAAMDRIISNMANNAIFAMKEFGGTLTFKLAREDLKEQLITPYASPIPPGSYARVTIADTGTGMDSSTLERIFSPFFTTKAPGEGLGLGLSSALRLLKEGNAYFTVHTRLGEGTIFNLYWTLNNEKQGEENVHSSDN